MSALTEFVRRLFDQGEAVLKAPPDSSPSQHEEATAFLREAFAAYRLQIAGPVLEFDAATAVSASQFLWHACWFLVNRSEPTEVLNQRLVLPNWPTTASQHLSADLVLRYLPQVHRRTRALAPGDFLVQLLGRVLREWPLSGVLAEVDEEPTTDLDFGGHPGLMLLYAERLAQNLKPSWLPHGQALDYVQLVSLDMDKERSVPPHPTLSPGAGERVG
jgi:hypothetical protein